MSANSLMTHRCTIKRATNENVDGIVESSYSTTVSSGTRCLIQEKSGMTKAGPAGTNLQYDAICFLPFGTDIRPRTTNDNKDQLTQTTPSGATYLVNFVAERSGKGNHLTAYLTRHQLPPS